jgi:hypothetical protein
VCLSSTRDDGLSLFKIEQTLVLLTSTLASPSRFTRSFGAAVGVPFLGIMKLGFDVFRKLDDGSPIWVANVQTRAQAEQMVESLRRSAPARYFVRDAESGAVIIDRELGT